MSRAALLGMAVLLVAGCSKNDQSSATASSTPAMAAVQVADVDLGRGVGPDKKITDKTDTFATRDTIYASVHTTGSAATTQLGARWTYENGTAVASDSSTISPTGDSYTEFHIAKATPWPAGKYTVHVLVDGQEAKTADFTVK